MAELKPLGDKIIVLQDEAETKSKGGIVLSAPEKPLEGRVIAIGKDVEEIEVSNKVIINKHGGTEVCICKVKFLILKPIDIIGVLEGIELRTECEHFKSSKTNSDYAMCDVPVEETMCPPDCKHYNIKD